MSSAFCQPGASDASPKEAGESRRTRDMSRTPPATYDMAARADGPGHDAAGELKKDVLDRVVRPPMERHVLRLCR